MNGQQHHSSTELAACRQELTEARAQHAAVAEVLRIIGRTTADLQAVLDRICERAGWLGGGRRRCFGSSKAIICA